MEALSVHSPEQARLWLRGLLTMAWADGHYDAEEQSLIESLLREDIAQLGSPGVLDPISGDDMAKLLDAQDHENFLRILLMVGLADGVYSASEDTVLREYSQAFGIEIPGLDHLHETLVTEGTSAQPMQADPIRTEGSGSAPVASADILHPLRQWLDDVEVNNRGVARFLAKLIPAECPFERDVVLFNRKIFHIPPMCKLNPLYDQVVGLRLRALNYLTDVCHEDVRPYL
ncbi:MAG: Mo-dependent nitrogenase C-terminal domain-containing protein [Synechococcales cyanobacterium]